MPNPTTFYKDFKEIQSDIKQLINKAKLQGSISAPTVEYPFVRKIDVKSFQDAVNALETNFSNNCCQSTDIISCQSSSGTMTCQNACIQCSSTCQSCQNACTQCTCQSCQATVTPKITLTWITDSTTPTGDVTYVNTSGKSKTATKPSSVTIKYNTKIKITNTCSSTHDYLRIARGSTYKRTISKGETWTSGKLTANTTYTITGISNWSGNSGGEGSDGEGGA